MNVVMITEKQDTVAQYSCLNSGVFVITLQVQTGRRQQEFCTCDRASLYFFFYVNLRRLFGVLFLEALQDERAVS